MKSNNILRAFFGLAVLLIGGILLAQNLGVIKQIEWKMVWGGIWSAAFVLAGLAAIINRKNWIWGIVLLAIGVSSALQTFGVVDINIWKLFWPAILMFVGVSVLFDMGTGKAKKQTSNSNIQAIFYGEEAKNDGEYTGGAISAVFGGVELDLRKADVKDGTEIEVFAFCGGIELHLPSDVIVENRVRGFLGGSEDKTRSDEKAKRKVIIKGDCILGGLEIR
jgi:hypothetical protein